MSWTTMPIGCWDLETTDKDPTTARIVTSCVATIKGSEVNASNLLLNPECDISDEAASIHGITTEIAQRDGMDYRDGIHSIWAALTLAAADGHIIAAFNVSFDATVLICESERLGIEVPVRPCLGPRGGTVPDLPPFFDGYVADRALDPYRKGKRTLGAVCDHYGVKLGDAHQADADALAAARLAWKLPRVYPQLADMSAEELQGWTAGAHAERQLSFREYRERIGEPADDISLEWPIRTAA